METCSSLTYIFAAKILQCCSYNKISLSLTAEILERPSGSPQSTPNNTRSEVNTRSRCESLMKISIICLFIAFSLCPRACLTSFAQLTCLCSLWFLVSCRAVGQADALQHCCQPALWASSRSGPSHPLEMAFPDISGLSYCISSWHKGSGLPVGNAIIVLAMSQCLKGKRPPALTPPVISVKWCLNNRAGFNEL